MSGNLDSLDKQVPVHRCLCNIQLDIQDRGVPRDKDNCFPCDTDKLCHFDCTQVDDKSV